MTVDGEVEIRGVLPFEVLGEIDDLHTEAVEHLGGEMLLRKLTVIVTRVRMVNVEERPECLIRYLVLTRDDHEREKARPVRRELPLQALDRVPRQGIGLFQRREDIPVALVEDRERELAQSARRAEAETGE